MHMISYVYIVGFGRVGLTAAMGVTVPVAHSLSTTHETVRVRVKVRVRVRSASI